MFIDLQAHGFQPVGDWCVHTNLYWITDGKSCLLARLFIVKTKGTGDPKFVWLTLPTNTTASGRAPFTPTHALAG